MEDEKQVMVIKVGKNEYGLDTDEIKRVVKVQALSHSQNVGVSNIAGMITLDDAPIPVVDIYRWFGAMPLESCGIVIIIVSKGKMLAVPVDRVEGVVNVLSECSHTIPQIVQEDGKQCIGRIAEVDGRLLPVISAERLFAEIGREV